MARKGKDLTDQRFGKLVVTGFAGYIENTRQRVSMWNCHCDCGKNCQVEGYLLSSGRRKSCGCIRRTADQMTGERFGKLVVISEDSANCTTLKKVLCRCDCGNIKSVATRDLKNGKTVSCGCDKPIRHKRSDSLECQYDPDLEDLRQNFQQGNFTRIHTLREWAYIWLREVLEGVIKATTIQMYAETMERHIFPTLGKQKLKNLSGAKLDEWLNHLSKYSVPGTVNGKMTEGTIGNILSVLRGCLRDAQKYGLIEQNPCLDVHFFDNKGSREDCIIWLDQKQIDQLEHVWASYQDEEGYPMGLGFQLVLYTGITLSEAAALQWKNVDLQNKTLNICCFVVAKKERLEDGRAECLEKLTGCRNRKVPIPEFMEQILKNLKEKYQAKPEAFVLSNRTKEPLQINHMRAVLKRHSDMCDMKPVVTPRILRDTYAMRAVQAGAASDLIAQLMGFASPNQVLRRYMPVNDKNAREIIERMFENRK